MGGSGDLGAVMGGTSDLLFTISAKFHNNSQISQLVGLHPSHHRCCFPPFFPSCRMVTWLIRAVSIGERERLLTEK